MNRTFPGCLLLLLILVSCRPRVTDVPPATASASPAPTVESALPLATPTPASPTWTRSNPGGGGAFAAISAGPTGIILAGSDLSGAYISHDQGASWSPIGYAHGLRPTHVSAVGFDPQDETILYLGTDDGLYRSADKGATFTQVIQGGYILDIKFSASNPNIGFASVHPEWNSNNGQVYKTVDRGRTWSQVSENLPSELRIIKVLINPVDENVLYFLSGGSRFSCGTNGLYQSLDGGMTWNELASDLPDIADIADIAINKIDPNILYFTTFTYVSEDSGHSCQTVSSETGELYQSTDAGQTWNQIAQHTGSIWTDAEDVHTVRLIAADRQDWDELSGMWETTDDGQTWNKVGDLATWDKGWANLSWTFSESFDGAAHTFGEDLSDPDALLWVNGQFAWVTRDKGRHFDNINTNEVAPGQWHSTGIDNVVMFDLAIGASAQDIYAGFYDLGCWHSPDNGQTWRNCNDIASTTVNEGGWQGYGGNTTAILADPVRAEVVWSAQTSDLGDPQFLLRSNDHAHTWQRSNRGLPEEQLSGLSVDVNSPTDQRVLFITAQKDVYRSLDDGWTWEQVFDCNGCFFTSVERFGGKTVYAGGEAGLFVSEAAGAPGSWKQAAFPAGSGDEPYGWDWSGVHRIRTDPAIPGRVYAVYSGPDGGLYRSDDRGASWSKLLSSDTLFDVAISPNDSNILYATSSSNRCCGGDPTNSQGVLRSTDGGRTWEQVNEGMAWPFGGPIAIAPGTPSRVWVGSPGTGFQWRLFPDP